MKANIINIMLKRITHNKRITMDRLKKIIAFIAFIAAVIIGFIAIFIPPTGIISSSVLWYIAQMLVFTSTIIGVNFKIQDIFSKKN